MSKRSKQQQTETRRKPGTAAALTFVALASLLQACAADPQSALKRILNTDLGTSDPAADQAAGAKTFFQQSDYYSLLEPNENQCAGDGRNYYDPFELSTAGPVAFKLKDDGRSTFKPSFVKNISVDVTDANSDLPSNAARGCSYGDTSGTPLPPPSNCATFDYGAIGGVPATLGGSLLLIGGVKGRNESGYLAPFSTLGFHGPSIGCGTVAGIKTDCGSTNFALSVDTLPAASAGTALAPGLASSPAVTERISNWVNLTSSSTTTTPLATAGAAIGYDPDLKQVLHFGGAGPLSSDMSGSTGDQSATWTYDIGLQKWNGVAGGGASTAFATSDMQHLSDCTNGSCTAGNPIAQLTKDPGGRSLFGYIAMPWTAPALNSNSKTGLSTTAGNVDTTDRVLIVAGKADPTGDNASNQYVYRFNPTFGPELFDLVQRQSGAEPANWPLQWLDNYHTQLLSTPSQAPSLFAPDYKPGFVSKGAYDLGLAPAVINNGGTTYGGAVAIGGFPGPKSTYAENAATTGRLYYSTPDNYQNLSALNGFPVIPPIDPTNGGPVLGSTKAAPFTWTSLEAQLPVVPAPGVIPPGGGAAVVPFSYGNNDYLYFGGSTCLNYRTANGSIDCNGIAAPFGTNPGYYYKLANDLSGTTASIVLNAPTAAGMAYARGEDPAGNGIAVFWGGINGFKSNGLPTDLNVYVAYPTGAPPVTVKKVAPTGGPSQPYINAAMVYSHVSKKFYLFGGYEYAPNPTAVAELWELSIGAAPAYKASWRLLNPLNSPGTSCYPSCPQGRAGHKMVEVNYSNVNPAARPDCSHANQPCSFGIFMEGGETANGNLISDRWMFDPTGGGGYGHWQQVNNMPPRHLAAMATSDFSTPSSPNKVQRAVMFGGETGLLHPELVPDANYFVPPTLGDTLMYDFGAGSWNRVALAGKGYNGAPPAVTDWQQKEGFDTTDDNQYALRTLSPPPLAGAMMVSRTHEFPDPSAVGAKSSPLEVPEVFLFGGRLKDGSIPRISEVYKFCTGTTGEHKKPTDATASAFTVTVDYHCDTASINNPASGTMTPTTAYVGRWLYKPSTFCKAPSNSSALAPSDCTTAQTTNNFGATTWNFAIDTYNWQNFRSYLGAAAYNQKSDKILLFGGISSAAATTTPPTLLPHYVFEYSPPGINNKSSDLPVSNWSKYFGVWSAIPVCTNQSTGLELDAPAPRYGHTLAYDSINQQIILVGGYGSDGAPFTTAVNDYTTSTAVPYNIPEVWVGTRVTDSGSAPDDISSITLKSTPCYYWKKKTVFGNSTTSDLLMPPTTGIGHGAGIFIPSGGYNSGYYTLFDNACTKAGPFTDSRSKELAGGIYIDLDRTALGANENLILHLTYIPLGPKNKKPDDTYYDASETADIKVHLIKTGAAESFIRQIFQPRHIYYFNTDLYPKTVETLSMLAPSDGSIRQDEIVIPLSIDPGIDRIRIERFTGSVIFIDATLLRMGAH